MNIAAITITRNDGFRLAAWREYYAIYRDELAAHIIVDNDSDAGYRDAVREAFPDSVYIGLDHNGGCTEAYNIGIRRALATPGIDAIMLIGNDIKLEAGGLTALHSFLYSDPRYGMVGPALMYKDSDEVQCYGCKLNYSTGSMSFMCKHSKYSDIKEDSMVVGYVPGGVSLSKPVFYGGAAAVGLQDENLFMYHDEVDMAFRAHKKGWLEAVTKSVKAWHQHIDYPSSRQDYTAVSSYLIARNIVYVNRKHLPLPSRLYAIMRELFVKTGICLLRINKPRSRRWYCAYWRGLVAGLRHNMDNSFMR